MCISKIRGRSIRVRARFDLFRGAGGLVRLIGDWIAFILVFNFLLVFIKMK